MLRNFGQIIVVVCSWGLVLIMYLKTLFNKETLDKL